MIQKYHDRFCHGIRRTQNDPITRSLFAPAVAHTTIPLAQEGEHLSVRPRTRRYPIGSERTRFSAPDRTLATIPSNQNKA